MSGSVMANAYSIEGQDISWAGECPWTNELCVGTEKGLLFFLNADHDPGESLTPIVGGHDAVNGVAFGASELVVTTRQSVNVGQSVSASPWHLRNLTHAFRGGAHSVIASHNSGFLAPIGDDGILLLRNFSAETCDAHIARHPEVRFNCLQIASLGMRSGVETIACACRSDGVFAFALQNGIPTGTLIGHHLGQDIVSICPVNDPRYPFAVIAISRNKRVYFFRNILEEKVPLSVEFDGLQGTPYTIMVVEGHLIVHSSSRLITLPNVAKDFLDDRSLMSDFEISQLLIEASGAFPTFEGNVLLTTIPSLSLLSISDIVNRLIGQEDADLPPKTRRVSIPAVSLRHQQTSRIHRHLTVPDWRSNSRSSLTLLQCA
jgi:hypothetical protein